MNDTQYLKEADAARLANLSPHTLRKWRQLQTGPSFVAASGRCVRYKREDVVAWLESRRVHPEAVGQTR